MPNSCLLTGLYTKLWFGNCETILLGKAKRWDASCSNANLSRKMSLSAQGTDMNLDLFYVKQNFDPFSFLCRTLN
jgi:hypothetical protein